MKLFSRRAMFLSALLFAASSSSYAAVYNIDKDHTSVNFKIKHLLSYVQGQFNEFEGTFEYDPENPGAAKTEMTVQAASIDTNVKERDTHLRSKDFFDVEKYPTLTFKSSKLTVENPGKGKLEGTLTIHGVEKPVVFDVDIHGVAKDPWGNVRGAFTATTKVHRKDFGLTWNKALEAGQVLVGEEVAITIEVEGIQQS